ncbi:MAG TPA: hypothetical protein VN920_07395 [Pyrinomonadaceae bacterium]|nr:hypothetical protein [Pyrinomonadaceae bacterium]
MSEEINRHVDTSSAEFIEGVEAGLKSKKDTKNWLAGNELGKELRDEGEKNEPAYERPQQSSTPLFMSNSPEGNKGNAQDEKDETEE